MNADDPLPPRAPILGVLFDLDGTLADTAPDLGGALNDLLDKYGRDPVPIERLRPRASSGARGMLGEGFGIGPADPFYEELREEYYQIYESRLCRDTVLFEGVENLIAELELRQVPWGIVTNKVARFARPLVAQLAPLSRAQCLVCGDTFDRPKPYPDPLVGAAQMLGLAPAQLLYVGDDERDMQAAQAAGMGGVVARYGYLGIEAPPEDWPADHHIDHPGEVLPLLR